MHRRLVPCALLVGALLAPAGAARAATCAGADTPVSASTLNGAKAAILCIVNAERDARGLPALSQNDKLALAAQRHTDDMVARDFFDHFVPDELAAPLGRDPGARLTIAGYPWQTYGENIATGQVTPREVMLGWMRSPGHCRNILDPDVTELGVGVAAVAATLPNQAGGTWTQDFGNPRGVLPPPASGAPQAGCDPSGYPSLLGLDPAEQRADTAPTPSATPQTDAAGTPSAPSRALTISLRHVGTLLVVGGSVRPWDGRRQRVSVVVRRAGRALRRTRARLDAHGRFRIRLNPVPGRGPVSVRVSVGALHVTRTVGR